MLYKVFVFYLSKIFWALAQPFNFLMGAVLVFALLRRWIFMRGLVICIVLLGVSPVGSGLIHHLERLYPVPQHVKADDFDRIVVLGGAIDLHVYTPDRGKSLDGLGQVSISPFAERFVEGVALARLYPDKPVIFVGGAGAAEYPDYRESDQVRLLMQKLNIDPDRFVFETKSRNTYENAMAVRAMVNGGVKAAGLDSGAKPKGERILLVTSGFHMMRSAYIFQNLGFAVVPYPVGYMESDDLNLLPSLNLLGNYTKLNIAVKEYIGIMAYRFLGKDS